MQHEPQPLDDLSVPPVERVRPRRWRSHMLTAALLCLIALFIDRQLRYDWAEARRVAQIEAALAIYGATCAVVSTARGALTRVDKFALAGCVLLFAFTAYVGLLMPLVIHN
jgi:hypothetical protein